MNENINVGTYRYTKQLFQRMSTAKQAERIDHLIYNIIRGKDPQLGFTKITNVNKLNNGQLFDSGWYSVENTAKLLTRYRVAAIEPIVDRWFKFDNEPQDEARQQLQNAITECLKLFSEK